MGMETAALAIGGGSSLLGSALQYGENRAARKRANQIQDQALGIANQPINIGQDSFMQYLRANPNALQPFQFDTSNMFKALGRQDTQTIGDQVAQLRAGAGRGGLGERFGTGFASREALLRGRFATDISARNAGIQQSSFNTALQFGSQDYNANRALQLQALLGGRGQQLQALGLGAGIQMPSVGAGVSQGGTDIAQLLLLMK